ncbi:hypothetical protein [Paenibacillus donghaensis]|uniref:Uncharacterized protein n=1 Tax=Paenibacillus donghaensis TaxID=414771 RepID=A0A2Z2KUA7_9BACL|nr:hypothetical protein [Paenibacillus donghaensis]ASA25652.1 hypothetical protein B9T62_35930 [Paenibacillus donghaensis]
MFGIGRKKVYLGQSARLLTHTLHDFPDTDYSQVEEVRNNFNEDEIKTINLELNLLKYIALQFEFMIVSLEKGSNLDSHDLSQSTAYAMRLAFEDFGYQGEALDNYANKFIEDFAHITENLSQLDSISRDIIQTTIAQTFTKNFLENTIGIKSNGEKRTVIMFHSTSIIVGVSSLMKDFLKQYKIIEF